MNHFRSEISRLDGNAQQKEKRDEISAVIVLYEGNPIAFW